MSYKITSRLLVFKEKGKMHFFITAKKNCHTRICPTQSSEKVFSMDSLQFVIKELGGQPSPRGGGEGGAEGTARWYI